jgi:glycosyltransferase involved in cell wall biosynthesis
VRLVFVTQTLDAEHPVLAQTVDVVRALAARTDELVVLCASIRAGTELPPNVRVRVFGAGSRMGRGVRFARELADELRHVPRPDAVLAHMVPLFLVLSAPLAKPLRVRLALWYTHWAANRTLRLATRLADVVLSVDRRSFPLDSQKVLGIGHAIDVARFAPAVRHKESGTLELVALGRTARWKGYDTLLAGFRLALGRGLDARLRIIGPSLTADERRHREELAAALPAAAELLDPVPREALPELLGGADALVSPAQSGVTTTLDKAVYEAAACGLPVVSSNPALADFLGHLPLELTFQPRDAAGLADRLVALGAAGSRRRAAVGAELRRRVVEGHSLDSWAHAVTATLARQRPE